MGKRKGTAITAIIILLGIIVIALVIVIIMMSQPSGLTITGNVVNEEIEEQKTTPITDNIEQINTAMEFLFSCTKNCPEKSGNVDKTCHDQCMSFTTAKYPEFLAALEKTTYFTEMGEFLSEENMIVHSCVISCGLRYTCSQECLKDI